VSPHIFFRTFPRPPPEGRLGNRSISFPPACPCCGRLSPRREKLPLEVFGPFFPWRSFPLREPNSFFLLACGQALPRFLNKISFKSSPLILLWQKMVPSLEVTVDSPFQLAAGSAFPPDPPRVFPKKPQPSVGAFLGCKNFLPRLALIADRSKSDPPSTFLYCCFFLGSLIRYIF